MLQFLENIFENMILGNVFEVFLLGLATFLLFLDIKKVLNPEPTLLKFFDRYEKMIIHSSAELLSKLKISDLLYDFTNENIIYKDLQTIYDTTFMIEIKLNYSSQYTFCNINYRTINDNNYKKYYLGISWKSSTDDKTYISLSKNDISLPSIKLTNQWYFWWCKDFIKAKINLNKLNNIIKNYDPNDFDEAKDCSEYWIKIK